MALYNNGYPATYPQYYQPMQVQQQNVSPVQNGRIWVQGEAGARSYLVAPNSNVELWDSEAQVIYLKSADPSGMPSIKILDYTVRETDKNTPISASFASGDKSIDYATKDEIKAVSEQITALRERVDNLTKKGKLTDE